MDGAYRTKVYMYICIYISVCTYTYARSVPKGRRIEHVEIVVPTRYRFSNTDESSKYACHGYHPPRPTRTGFCFGSPLPSSRWKPPVYVRQSYLCVCNVQCASTHINWTFSCERAPRKPGSMHTHYGQRDAKDTSLFHFFPVLSVIKGKPEPLITTGENERKRAYFFLII